MYQWSLTNIPGQDLEDWPNSLLNINTDMGEFSQKMPILPLEEDLDLDDFFSTCYSVPVIPHLAAVKDDVNIPYE
jgi:hypothetical protein